MWFMNKQSDGYLISLWIQTKSLFDFLLYKLFIHHQQEKQVPYVINFTFHNS